jgi:hypothetical protein
MEISKYPKKVITATLSRNERGLGDRHEKRLLFSKAMIKALPDFPKVGESIVLMDWENDRQETCVLEPSKAFINDGGFYVNKPAFFEELVSRYKTKKDFTLLFELFSVEPYILNIRITRSYDGDGWAE